MNDSVENRLRAIRATTPPGLRERVLAAAQSESGESTLAVPKAAHHRMRRAALATAAIILVLLAGNAAALRVSPAYATRVGSTPWVGPLGQEFGIVPSTVAPSGQIATDAGHTIRLLGVDANPLQTLVFVQVDNQPTSIGKGDPNVLYPLQVSLTDQFGTQYGPASLIDSTLLTFGPIRGPAAVVGAHLTLTVQQLGHEPTVGPSPPGTVHGAWTFSFDSTIKPLQPLPAVAPLTTPQLTCDITDPKASGNYLSFTAKYSGPLVQNAWRSGPQHFDYSFIQPTVQDASGSTIPPLQGLGLGYGSDATSATGYWAGILPGPGTYTLSCSAPGSGAPTTTIQVP